MKPSSLIHAIGRPIAFNPGLVPILGSVNAVLFFGQIYFWMNHTQNPLGVYKSAEEIENETGLSYREQSTARAKLVEIGVLIETHKRLEHRIYFSIDVVMLDALLANHINRISRNDKSAVRETTKAQSVETTKAQFDIQRLPESTSETTAEKASASAPAAEPADAYLKRLTTESNARQPVMMTIDWKPSEQFKTLMMRAGLKPDTMTDAILAKFQIHYNGESKPQNKWESALVTWCKREKPEPAIIPPEQNPDFDYPLHVSGQKSESAADPEESRRHLDNLRGILGSREEEFR